MSDLLDFNNTDLAYMRVHISDTLRSICQKIHAEDVVNKLSRKIDFSIEYKNYIINPHFQYFG